MTLAPDNSPKPRKRASRVADAALGERAHMLIWRSGRKQEAVALALGIDPTGFGKKLRGKNGWAVQEIIDLATELNSSVAYLVGESDEPHPNLPPKDYKVADREAVVTPLRPRIAS